MPKRRRNELAKALIQSDSGLMSSGIRNIIIIGITLALAVAIGYYAYINLTPAPVFGPDLCRNTLNSFDGNVNNIEYNYSNITASAEIMGERSVNGQYTGVLLDGDTSCTEYTNYQIQIPYRTYSCGNDTIGIYFQENKNYLIVSTYDKATVNTNDQNFDIYFTTTNVFNPNQTDLYYQQANLTYSQIANCTG